MDTSKKPRIVKLKKQEGEYETKDYVRRAVKNYEERLRNLYPERYLLRLQKKRDRYRERKQIKKEEQIKKQTPEENCTV